MKPATLAALALLLLASGCAGARKPKPYVIKVTPVSNTNRDLIQHEAAVLREAAQGIVFAGTAPGH